MRRSDSVLRLLGLCRAFSGEAHASLQFLKQRLWEDRFQESRERRNTLLQCRRKPHACLDDRRYAALDQGVRDGRHVAVNQVHVKNGSVDRILLQERECLFDGRGRPKSAASCLFHTNCQIDADERLVFADQNTCAIEHETILEKSAARKNSLEGEAFHRDRQIKDETFAAPVVIDAPLKLSHDAALNENAAEALGTRGAEDRWSA